MPTPPGKPYTMGEMKAIVEYLVEHKAYGQIKARRMWQDFQQTGRVNRTWQSMKETFLKRILPDLHNPYYKLTAEQKQSFKQGTDIEARNDKIKLEVQTSESSSDRGDNQEEAIAKNNSGEHKNPSKMDCRSKESVETVVLDARYDTSEDIARELESSHKDTDQVNKSPSKSLRDLITYSEPLTPMAQEVIDDFATDEDEPRLQIVEDIDSVANGRDDRSRSRSSSKHSHGSSKIRKSVRMLKPTEHNIDENDGKSKESDDNKIRSLKLKKTLKGTWKNQSTENDEANNIQTNNKVDEADKDNNNDVLAVTKDTGNETATKDKDASKRDDTTADTQLPNNQEQLSKTQADKPVSIEKPTDESEKEERPPKKRRPSKSVLIQSKKKIQQENKDVNDTQEKRNNNHGSQVPDIISSDIKDTQTFDSHPNIKLNKTAGLEEETFNSHGNEADTGKATAGSDIGTLTQSTSLQTQEAGPSNKKESSSSNPSVQSVEEQIASLHYSDSDDQGTSKEKNQEQTSTKQDKDPVVNESDERNNSEEVQTVKEPQPSGSGNQGGKPKEAKRKSNSIEVSDDIVMLKSHSESEERRYGRPVFNLKPDRCKTLANIFASGSGAGNRRASIMKRKNHRFSRRRTVSRNISNYDVNVGTSDYTSESESEDMSRHRRRQQIPPQSYDIVSHDGAKFVVIGNKLYPLLISRRHSFHHVVGPIESDEESDHNEESYWKQKYMDLRKVSRENSKKVDELARLLKELEQDGARPGPSTSGSRTPSSRARYPEVRKNDNKDAIIEINSDTSKNSEPVPNGNEEKPVKIRFNDNEIELECHPKHAPEFLAKMQQLFGSNGTVQIDKNRTNSIKSGTNSTKNETNSTSAKERRTPTPEVSKKVEEIESEIFKEIAEKDKIDDANVTKRKRGRPKKSISSLSTDSLGPASAQKKMRSEGDKAPSPGPETSAVDKTTPPVKETTSEPKLIRKTDKPSNVQTQVTIQHKRSARNIKKSSTDGVTIKPADAHEVTIPSDDSTIRYKLPKRSTSESRVTKKNNRTYLEPRMLASPETLRHSVDDSQGYEDSESTPSPIKKKKKRSVSAQRYRKSSHIHSHPYQADVDTYDNSHHFASGIELNKSLASPAKQTSAKDNSTLNTSEYRSESYENLNLIPTRKTKPELKQLEQIDENSNDVTTSIATRYFSLSPISLKVNTELHISSKNTERNSSVTPLPSPESSVVENLSISKETLSGAGDHPTLNETQSLECMKSAGGKYLLSDVDVTTPLMAQDCEVRKATNTAMSVSGCPSSAASESLLHNLENVEESSSDSLDKRLRNLLLESAKKMAQQMQAASERNSMEIDEIVATMKKVRKIPSPTLSKRRSRASTPLPRPVLKEHVESCTKAGRKSCPPVINVIGCESPPSNANADNLNNEPKTKTGRRQKDVLKVKIVRPKKKSLTKERRARSSCQLSACTDSGINDTESGILRDSDDSVELIHNHSETCMQANECIGDSIEFVDVQDNILTLSSGSEKSHIGFGKICDGMRTLQDVLIDPTSRISNDNVTTELFCDNAQDATNLDVAKRSSQRSQEAGSNAASMASLNSLLTEDLSDESPPRTSWHLISDEETGAEVPNDNINSYGLHSVHTHLKQLFNTCAIPDLSTITEGSREDTENRRETFESNSNTY